MKKEIIKITSDDIKNLNDIMNKVQSGYANGTLTPEDIKVARTIIEPLYNRMKPVYDYIVSIDKKYEQLRLQLEEEDTSTTYITDNKTGYVVKGHKVTKWSVNSKALHKLAQPSMSITTGNPDFSNLDMFDTSVRMKDNKVIALHKQGRLPSYASHAVKESSHVQIVLYDLDVEKIED